MIFLKIYLKKLLIAIAIPLLAGGLSAFISKKGMASFNEVTKPPLSPPNWLFPVAWSILYILMGIASYLVYVSGKNKNTKTALYFYGIQLIFNFFWSLFFFNTKNYLFSFVWLIVLWFLIIITTVLFRRINKTASFLMIPYIIWVTFAAYLNLGIYILNK